MNRSTPGSLFSKGAHPSLFPLRMVLFTAELETPTQPSRTSHDTDELLAIKLIERIKHPRSLTFKGKTIEPVKPIRTDSNVEMVGAHG